MLTASPRVSAIGVRVLALSIASAGAHAQHCPSLPDASNVYVFEDAANPGRSYSIDPDRVFIPDRRPVAVVAPYNGSYSDTNPFGWVGWFRDPETCGPELVQRLEDAWDAGFRRIVLNRPGGILQDNDMVQMSMFWYLEQERRQAYSVHMRDWIAEKRLIDPDLEVGIFLGSRHNSPCTPCLEPTGVLSANSDCMDDPNYMPGWQGRLDAATRQSAEWTYQNTAPYLNNGVNALWFDSASLRGNTTGVISMRESILALQHNPDYAGVRIGGEAVPEGVIENGQWAPNPAVLQAPWIALHRFFIQDSRAGEVYDPATTEVGVAFMKPDVNPVYDIRDMADFRDRGYVLWSWRAFSFEMMQRLHDGENNEFYDAVIREGTLADFNADEVVNQRDLLDFLERVTSPEPPVRPAIWDGDVNNDDRRDFADIVYFLTMYGA
jgi:hypothetical protein